MKLVCVHMSGPEIGREKDTKSKDLQEEASDGMVQLSCFANSNEEREQKIDGINIVSVSQFDEGFRDRFEDSSFGFIVICFTRLQLVLAEAIEKGSDTEEVIKSWEKEATSLLAIFKQHRRKAFCLIEGSLLREVKSLNLVLLERFGVELDAAFSGPETLPNLAPRPLLLALADHLLSSKSAIQRLLVEIEACCVPLSMTLQDSKEAILEYRELTKIKHHPDFEERNKELKCERDLLLKQLHAVQERYEKVIVENNCASEALEEKARDLIAIQNSLSWKITSPLRLILKPLVRNNLS